jgi:hypothetical protein
MPAGIPGIVTRPSMATVEPQVYSVTNTFPAYGVAAKVGTDFGMQPLTTGDAATALYGLLIKPFPTNASQSGLGVSVPPVSGICDILKRGYMMVLLNGAAAATKDGQVYIWIAASSGAHVIGGFEAAASSGNTIAPAGLVFTGPADASGNVEVAWNL